MGFCEAARHSEWLLGFAEQGAAVAELLRHHGDGGHGFGV